MGAWPSSQIAKTGSWPYGAPTTGPQRELVGVAPYEVMATTVAVIGDDLYVVHPHFQDDGMPSVERVEFE